MPTLPTNAVRFQVSIEEGHPRVTPLITAAPAAARDRKPPLAIVQGVVRIYRSEGKYESFLLAWRDGFGRHRERRNTLKRAKDRAGEIARDVLSGRAAMLQFTETDRASYLRATELCAPLGKSIELVAADYADLVKTLAGHGSLAEAVKYYVERRPAGMTSKNVPDVVTELLAFRRRKGAGEKWLNTLGKQLKRFGEWWTGPIHLLENRGIDDWLDSLKKSNGSAVAPKTQDNYRRAVLELTNFAEARHYMADGWAQRNPVEPIEVPAEQVKILEPGHVARLLMAARDTAKGTMVPFIALAAFAGVRHEEMGGSKKKRLLQWQDINWKRASIRIQEGTAKTGKDRIVPMSPNLVAWLQSYAKPSGPVCKLKNTSNALARLKKRAGLAHGRGETSNTLRKSFISYRLAVTQNHPQVAAEAGNSVGVIETNYKEPLEKELGEAWFDIWPPKQDQVVQLPLAL